MPRRRQGEVWLDTISESGVWYIHWYDAKVKRVRRKTTGLRDRGHAEVEQAKFILERVKLKKADPQDVPMALIIDRYLKKHAANIASAESARFEARYWLEFFGDDYVSDVTPDRQEEFIDGLRRQGKSDGYIHRILSTGRAALNRAYRRKELASVPYIISIEKPEARERVLSQDEMLALLTEGPDHLFMFIMVMATTLCRPENALDLTRFQCNADERIVRLNPPGRKQTRKYRPIIPMCKTLRALVEGCKTDTLVSYRGKPIASMKTAWRAARREGGLGKDVVPKTVRHTMATELRARGVVPWEVAGMLGHKSGEMRITEGYAKYVADRMRGAADAIDGYFSELSAPAKKATSRKFHASGLSHNGGTSA